MTNNNHVLRTAVLARQIGDAQAVGAPTARYYLPSAFLREYVAIVWEHRRLHVAVIVSWMLLVTLFYVTLSLGYVN